MWTKLLRVIKNPSIIILRLMQSRLGHIMPDKMHLKIKFWLKMGKSLNLDNPVTFNEKMQWLKLYNRKLEYTTMVDKYAVKQYVSSIIGEEYIIPTLGVWDSFDDIDFDSLPDQFVLKCTHDSGTVVICKNKATFDIDAARKKINRRINYNYFYEHREWPYKDVPRRIIAEKYMEDHNFPVLNVFKVFNFNNGEQIIQAIQNDKTPEERIDYFDTEWNLLELRQNYENSTIPLPKPKSLDRILNMAKRLSDGFAFLRTDFYEINGDIYFSEFTFFSDAGFAQFTPPCWDEILGERIDLSIIQQQK